MATYDNSTGEAIDLDQPQAQDQPASVAARNGTGGFFEAVARGLPGYNEARESRQRQDINQQKIDDTKRAGTAMKEFADLLDKYTPPQKGVGPQDGDPHERLGFSLYTNPSVLKNPKFLNDAAQIFVRNRQPSGLQWLQSAHKASGENLIDALKVATAGDLPGAEQVFNSGGGMKIQPGTLKWADEKKTSLTGVDAQGREFTVNPHELIRQFVAPEDALKRAQADYYSGRNEANVTGRQISADARVDAAEVTGDSRVDAANIRANAGPRGGVGGAGARAPAAPRGPSAPSAAPYGGDKGQAKWTDDFEKHFMPKRDAMTEDGKPKIDPKTGAPVQELDEENAPIIRDMARINVKELNAAGIHPQEAAHVFTQFAKAFKGGDRAKAYSTLDKAGRLAIIENGEGHPVKAVGIMGQYRDAQGATRPIFFELPEKMSDELVTQEFQNRQEKDKAYPDETKRVQRPSAGGGPQSAAAVAATRGTARSPYGPGASTGLVNQAAHPSVFQR